MTRVSILVVVDDEWRTRQVPRDSTWLPASLPTPTKPTSPRERRTAARFTEWSLRESTARSTMCFVPFASRGYACPDRLGVARAVIA